MARVGVDVGADDETELLFDDTVDMEELLDLTVPVDVEDVEVDRTELEDFELVAAEVSL